MLYKAGAIGRPGTVDAKNTVSDFMADEQERRASIYSTCMNCMWKNNQFFFVDTPGYGEFIGQAAAAVRAADAALAAVSVLLLGLTLAGTAVGATVFCYYPRISALPLSPFSVAVYAAFGLLSFLPFVIEAKEALVWKYYISKM